VVPRFPRNDVVSEAGHGSRRRRRGTSDLSTSIGDPEENLNHKGISKATNFENTMAFQAMPLKEEPLDLNSN
jgi:hypothetical protein